MRREDIIRYSRQIALDEIGEEGQEKLLAARVMVVGCGALGSMVAMQLAGAGVGTIGIADFDTIDISNLQRQYFFKTSEAGKPKADVLEERIGDLNPQVWVIKERRVVTDTEGRRIFPDYDFIIDATDNPASKRMVEQKAGECGKTCCIGGVKGFSGQVMTIRPGGIGFTEIFGVPEESGCLPCSSGGVMGPAAALCASVQSMEAIKHITGAGATLAGKILSFDLLAGSFNLTKI